MTRVEQVKLSRALNYRKDGTHNPYLGSAMI